MKGFLIILFGTMAVLVACDKDDFETKPKIEITSTSANVVPRNSDLRIDLRVTDKEGDVDDSVVVVRERLNERAADPRSRELRYKIPEFPDNNTVDMEVILDNSTALTLASPAIPIPGSQGEFEPDTLSLKFVVIDRAKNVSDTVSANVVVIR